MFPPAPPHPTALAENPELKAQVDDRIFLDKGSNQWVFESDQEYHYNFILQQWIPADPKRPNEEENKQAIKRIKREKLDALKQEVQKLKHDTPPTKGVYIQNLPDTTEEEVAAAFSKYGLISENLEGRPRVKLYYDGDKFKGEALVIYHSDASVPLAIEMMNDTEFHPGSGKLHVEVAQFSEKDKEKRILTAKEKQLLHQRKEAMKKKLAEWDEPARELALRRKFYDRVVVAENMFRPPELDADDMLELDLKDDIQEECDKFGVGADVTSIKVNKKGFILIKFGKPESALKCVAAFKDRFYDGLKLAVSIYSERSDLWEA